MEGNATVVSLLIWSCCAVLAASGSTSDADKQQYCPYFQNREPTRQENLKNCTWYQDNACCSDAEVEFAFSQLTPLPGADDRCQKYLNYLYCYICAPNQNSFFSTNTLTVCEEFCNDVFFACGSTLLKGRRIKELYSNGKEFCISRRFRVDREVNGKCFAFDGEKHGTSSKTQKHEASRLMLLSFLWTALFTKLLVA